MDDEAPKPELPPGEYAIVELFGHTTLVGRIAEVERFGAKMLAMEPIYAGKLLPAIFHGGAAIYRLTPCDAEVALKQAPTSPYQIPPSLRAVVPPPLLEATKARAFFDVEEENDDGE